MTLYPEIIHSLLDECRRYRQREIDISALQSAIWNAAEQVVSLEDRELRQMLRQMEGELELIRFTTDSDKIFTETLKALDPLETALEGSLR